VDPVEVGTIPRLCTCQSGRVGARRARGPDRDAGRRAGGGRRDRARRGPRCSSPSRS